MNTIHFVKDGGSKMALTHSLTAYRCTFSFMERNNPIDTDKMKESIKNGEKPVYSLSAFINDYISSVSSLSVGQNANRAIQLTQISSTATLPNDVTRIHLQPQAGKHGEPITVVEKATNQRHKYGKDDAALYEYNVFLYEKDGEIVALFYRKGTSGCKTVFLETANNALRLKGMKLEMNLIFPLNQTYTLENAKPSKVGIQWLVPRKQSSDIADEMDENDSSEKKEKWVQKLIIDLKPKQSNPIKTIIERFTNGQIDKSTAFAKIKTKSLVPDNADFFNDAFIQYDIGGRKTVTVRFGEIENQIGAYDITGSLDISDFVNSLLSCADAYYSKIAGEML